MRKISLHLATILAVLPLVAGTDPCTVGALIGRASLVCVARVEAMLALAAQSAPSACERCGPAAPDPRRPQPRGDTCCDLKPQAPGRPEQPGIALASTAAHPLCLAHAALPAPGTAWVGAGSGGSDESPPGQPRPSPLPRAPPLS